MTKKTVKELDLEFNLIKKELKDLQNNFDALATKYENLEAKYEECISRKIKSFKCNLCDVELGNKKELQKHKRNLHTNDSFQCSECEQTFNEEWKLNAHLKSHKKYSCDYCERTFKYEDTKEKHVKIAHEDYKLYCHYFNNGKECPFVTECVFLHEDSDNCRYGDLCERDFCMYKHVVNTNEDGDDNGDEDEEDVEKNDDDDHANKTFVNPFKKNVVEIDDEVKKDENLLLEKNEDVNDGNTGKYCFVNGKYTCRACKQYAFMCDC